MRVEPPVLLTTYPAEKTAGHPGPNGPVPEVVNSTPFTSRPAEATKAQHGLVGYLEALLAAELEERERNAVARRIFEAKLPRVKTLEEFDFAQAPHRALSTGDE